MVGVVEAGSVAAGGEIGGAGGVVVDYCCREGHGDDGDGRVARFRRRVGEWGEEGEEGEGAGEFHGDGVWGWASGLSRRRRRRLLRTWGKKRETNSWMMEGKGERDMCPKVCKQTWEFGALTGMWAT